MEVKKSPKADLEGKKSTWLLIGYVLILAVVFVAFECSERDKQILVAQGPVEIKFEEDMVPITQQEQKPTPPPPQAPSAEEVLNIVENDANIEETEVATSEDKGEAVQVVSTGPAVVVEEVVEEEQIFQVVEEMPSFPGGDAECMRFLNKNIKYPTIAQENGIQGRVILQFVVNKDGSIVDVVVARSVDPYLDKEAVRVVNMMPKWKPGKQRGKPVRVKFTLPVTFRLQ